MTGPFGGFASRPDRHFPRLREVAASPAPFVEQACQRPFKPYIPMNGTAVLFCSPAPQQRSHPYLSLFSSHCGSGRGLRIPSGPPKILAGQVLPGTALPVRTASLHLRFRPATQSLLETAFCLAHISFIDRFSSRDRSFRGLRIPSGRPMVSAGLVLPGTSFPVRTASLSLRQRLATQDRGDPAFVTLRISILTTGTSCDRSSGDFVSRPDRQSSPSVQTGNAGSRRSRVCHTQNLHLDHRYFV